jgi:hypothetical protein
MLRRLVLALPLLAATGIGAAQAQGCDTRFDLINNSGRTIMEFYFDSSRNPNWTRDELGRDVLPAGQVRRFRAVYSGNYDFRAVFQGGGAQELRQVNVCQITKIIVTDRGMRAE